MRCPKATAIEERHNNGLQRAPLRAAAEAGR